MPEICGDFAARSTANYPHAPHGAARLEIRMVANPNAALIRLVDDALGRTGKSDRKASLEATGKVDVIRQLRRGHRPRADALAALARVLEIDPGEVFKAAGVSPYSVPVSQHDREGPDHSGPSAVIPELDVRAGAGGGTLAEAQAFDAPVGEWQLPLAMLQGQTSAPISALRIITVYGDSMEPELPAGAKVIVDTADVRPTPPGIFVVHDGMGLVLKRVEHIHRSDPPRVRLISDNPRYTTYEVTAEEAQLQGRVIGSWRWR
jgi:phage repressor protein C with HTH and peptisase S24 domain